MKKKLYIAFILIMTVIVVSVVSASADNTAVHFLIDGGTGATSITILSPYSGMYCTLGPTINNHQLSCSGTTINAFCTNPYFYSGDTYTDNADYDSQGDYPANYELACKYIAMYLQGYPSGGYNATQKKTAVQMAVFNCSQLGTDYPGWASWIFNGSAYYNAYNALLNAAQTYTTPPTTAVLSEPNNIDNVALVLNSNTQCYEGTVNAGSQAQYYSWNGYASLEGNSTLSFSVPASDLTSWDRTADGGWMYTSSDITGTGPNTTTITPHVWGAGSSLQQLITIEMGHEVPTNTTQYTLVVEGVDEGVPGGGGGYYGGITSSTSAVAGGGSGHIGSGAESGTTVGGNTTITAPTGESETGHYGNGYTRITLAD